MEMVNDALSQHTQTGVMPKAVGKLPPDEFMKFVNETRAQPAWRTGADKAADYYDHNQLTPEVLQMLDSLGFPQLMNNLIKPAVDTVLGLEAKNRTDFRAVADDDAHQEVAEALSAKLAEVERQSRADVACSQAYKGQVISGMGWAHVNRRADPFLYPISCEAVHRREMFWDWATPVSDPLLDTARYIIRQKWYPVDSVTAAMPEHAPLINASASGWSPDWMQRASENTTLMSAIDQESRISVSAWDWRNIDNRRVALQECWYATYIRGLVLRINEDRVVEFDKNNPLHVAAVNAGKVRPEPSVYRKLRCSMWFGPHLLQDSDPGTNKSPYVPFWGFREDLTGVPYGLVRGMMPLQDEINARRRKLMLLLASKRVQVDSDALDKRYNSMEELLDIVSDPDAVIVTNPSRTNKDAIRVESDLGLSQQQFEVLQEAKDSIQSVAGIFNSLMGKRDGGANSGLAINSLVEQSSNTLAELNASFRSSRQAVGDRLVELIKQDMSGREVKVIVGPQGAARKVISLNTPKIDPILGVEYRENDTDKALVKIALEEVPSTPAYRAQQMMQIGEVIKSLPPQAQAVMVPRYIEASDLAKRHEMAADVRKALGMQTDGQEQDPQVAALQQQLQDVMAHSEEVAKNYEAAVQEQAQRAQAAEQDAQLAKMQLRDRAAELELRRQELANTSAKEQQAIGERVEKLRLQQAQEGNRAAEMDLERQRLSLEAAKASADHESRVAEMEANQLTVSRERPTDEADEERRMQDIVERVVAPLVDKLDTLIDAALQT